MTEQLDSASDYVPIHRIAVACRSCRRKKARCTGDQPACGNCRRLRIECIYSADTTKSETSSTTAQQNSTESPSPGDLASILTRLSSIEETLQVFGSHIQSIRSDLDFLVGHRPPKRPMEEETQHQSRKKQLIDHDDPTPSIQDLSKEHTLPATEGSFLPREVTLAIIDAYFTYCHNQPYCFFHEASFRLQFSLGNIPKHLLSAVLATAIRFSAHPYFTNRVNDVANEYANHSWKLVVANCFATSQPPNVSLVQTLCLLGLFDFTGKSRHAAAWVKSGLAVRMAQELGLMQDAAPEVSIYIQEERRRVFWSVYLLDRLISCGRGRPLAVLDASCPLQLPSTDQAWRDGSVEIAPTLDTLTNRQSETCNALSPFAHVVAAASLLGRSIQYSLQQCNLHGRCPPWDPRSDFAALESDLLHLEFINGVQAPVEELLGSYVTAENGIDQPGVSPVIISRIIFHLSYCLLNHPFLLRQRLASSKVTPPSSFLARAFDTAWRHACHMIELVRSARKHGYVLTASSSGYCIMVAGSIIALNKHSEDSYISAQAESLIQDVIAALDSLGRYWYNVSNMVPALQLVMERSAELYELSSPKAQVVDLTSPDSDLMWSVVDYGSISNSSIAECGQNNVSTPDLWFESFYNLFGAQHSGNEPEYLDLTMDPFSIVPL